MNENLLIRLGFTEQESRVYHTLSRNNNLTLAELARLSHLHRPLLYRLLPRLQKRGLITSHQKGKRTIYSAADPDVLIAIAADTQRLVAEEVPELRTAFQRRSQVSVRRLEGADGIKLLFSEIVESLPKGSVIYRYSSGRERLNSRARYLSKTYQARRDEKKIERFVIASPEYKNNNRAPKLERMVRIVPKDYSLFEYNISQIIYGDKLALINYDAESATIIEDATLVAFQRRIFKAFFQLLGDLPENKKTSF